MTTTKETSDDGWDWADTLLILYVNTDGKRPVDIEAAIFQTHRIMLLSIDPSVALLSVSPPLVTTY